MLQSTVYRPKHWNPSQIHCREQSCVWEWKWGRNVTIYTHTCQEMSREFPVSKLEADLCENSRKFWLENPVGQCWGLVWMCLKRDYRVENWGGQVEQWSLMCKGRIRNWVDLTGVCSLCVEEPINGLHTNHLLVNIWHMHMLPRAQSACTHTACLNVLLNMLVLAVQ